MSRLRGGYQGDLGGSHGRGQVSGLLASGRFGQGRGEGLQGSFAQPLCGDHGLPLSGFAAEAVVHVPARPMHPPLEPAFVHRAARAAARTEQDEEQDRGRPGHGVKVGAAPPAPSGALRMLRQGAGPLPMAVLTQA